ncbi:hypothetical protein DM02DRAFT_544813 [Periconia macrospinosa]|uniref:polynucleotide adenylyltransferase n=1 Tax=Periconia macrospinosa TaxID=97972 RepID=A0A2V1D1L5_9PLEO|nr:hypothetical protein DM02DRAFT_544813 [Periconia macrospinosa]
MADSYRPDRRTAPNRVTFGDSYRPAGHHAQFTYSSDLRAPQFPPAGPADMQQRGARRMHNRGGAPGTRNDRNFSRGGNSRPSHAGMRNGNRAPQRGGRRAAPHERALLQSRDDTIEHAVGVSESSNKFNLDILSEDDSEAAMDLETDLSDDDDDAASSNKRKAARVQSESRADGDSVPRWCNPDPYTSLPPPEETTGKKIDFVKLIRKAKNESAGKVADGTNAVAANDDFISFGLDGTNDDGDDDDIVVVGANTVNRNQVSGSLNDIAKPLANPPSAPNVPQNNGRGTKRSAESAGLPERPQARPDRRRRGDMDGDVLQQWRPRSDDCTPWVAQGGYSYLSDNPRQWLHNEILDFYDWICPQTEEDKVRNSLIDRLDKAFDKSQFSYTGRLEAFGSFPTGLYLPGADMDLVYRSDHYKKSGEKVFQPSTNKLWKIARALENRGVAKKIMVIGRAKVPIIKFVETRTNLSVDISFENLGGVDAVGTVRKWVKQFPDMIYLVALVKQFLAMRGLNEVNTQGLGGFSIICLAVSYLQHTSQAADVGDCFLGFLDYYGNKFNLATHRIIMSPAQIVRKSKFGIDGREERADGLSIQDPNNPQNNISGGSRKAKLIFDLFAHAHADLVERMHRIKNGEISPQSILQPIFGGDYRVYDEYRQHMERLK